MDKSAGGFMRVRGKVVRIGKSRKTSWINLEGRFAVRIPEQDLRWFPTAPDRSWLGRELEVRGWLYTAKGETRVNVHHPAALQITGGAVP